MPGTTKHPRERGSADHRSQDRATRGAPKAKMTHEERFFRILKQGLLLAFLWGAFVALISKIEIKHAVPATPWVILREDKAIEGKPVCRDGGKMVDWACPQGDRI